MGVSRRQLAPLLGVSESAVRKAIKAGRIAVEPDGTIDPQAAREAWARTSDPARIKARTGPAHGAHGARTTTEPPLSPDEMAEAAIEGTRASTLVREVLKAEGHQILADAPIDFALARTAEKIVQVHARKQAVDRAAENLLDAKAVERRWSERVAMFRARMLAVPGDVAIELNHLTKHDLSIVDRVVRDALQSVFDEVATRPG